MKDKNNREIYEGDTVELYKENFTVKFFEGEFIGDNSDMKNGILSEHELKESIIINR